jgi:hypothetical protein
MGLKPVDEMQKIMSEKRAETKTERALPLLVKENAEGSTENSETQAHHYKLPRIE